MIDLSNLVMKEVVDLVINSTFDKTLTKLPTNSFIREYIYVDNDRYSDESTNCSKLMQSLEIRHEYTRYSFPILTDEFIVSLGALFKSLNINKIVEINAGTGFLTYWMRKYGINIIDCIDNYSWEKDHFKQNILTEVVNNFNSIHYVKNHRDIELFILSWPYMDQTAARIWNNMYKGQHLLYIGESDGGCTANDKFFELTDKFEINNDKIDKVNNNYLSFDSIHDRVRLYKK